MRVTAIVAVVLVPALVAACASGGPKEGAGTVVGAVAGGLVGSQIGGGSGRVAAAIGGAALGGFIGNRIGAGLDERDRQAAWEAQYRALEYGNPGTPTSWRSPHSGRYGNVVPGRPYQESGRHCRDYTHTIYIDGRPQTARGQACRNPDGTWRKVA